MSCGSQGGSLKYIIMVPKIKELIPISIFFLGVKSHIIAKIKFYRGMFCHKFPIFLWKNHQNLKKNHHISLLGF
jgi:hypothetical protein